MKDILEKKQLFWDVVAEKLNKETDWFFIIERILEYGDIEDWSWLKDNFTNEQITEVGSKSRILSPKTKAFLKVMRYAS
jgi:hypothetical protein